MTATRQIVHCAAREHHERAQQQDDTLAEVNADEPADRRGEVLGRLGSV